MVNFTEENTQKLFGHEAAEDEDPKRLQEYYFKSSIYERIVTDLPVRILVGHKGIGKSALLKVAIAEDSSRGIVPVMIKPNDILELSVDATDFLHTIRNWQDGLTEIVIRKVLSEFGLRLPDAVDFRRLRGSIVGYLVNILGRNLENGASERFAKKRSQVSRFIDSPRIAVYVDDLDRGWQGRREDVTRISALLNAVRDLSNDNREIHFRIALRSDVYYLVRTSDESTDKIEGSVVWHTWTNHEIFVLLIKRIETYFGRTINERELLLRRPIALAQYLEPIMEPRFSGSGIWENAPTYRVMMSLIRRRPRDLVKLCTLAAHNAYVRKSQIIQAQDFQGIFEEYSQGRIQDTINEYRSELPDISRLLMNMKPNRRERTAKEGYVYRTDALLDKIDDIMQQGYFTFSNGRVANKKDLAAFLYKINFLTARKVLSDNSILRKYFEENRYLSSGFVDFGFDWEVHPAYRWALQPTDIRDLILQLSADDD